MGTYLMSNAYPNGPYLLTPTVIHVHPVQDDRCEALGNCIDASIMEVYPVLRIQFVSLFLQYTKLLNPFYFVAFIPQE